MRLRLACLIALVAGAPAVAAADESPPVAPSASSPAAAPPSAPVMSAGPGCESPGSLECPTYERFINRKYGFSVDVPTCFTRKTGDADGRGQPFEYGSKARIRAWAMFDNPPMTLQQLYADWTRRDGLTFKALAGNTWIVRGREGGRLFYSRSILSEGLITTVDVAYDKDIADSIEPVLARMGASLQPLPGEGLRGKGK
jgi:hypothetical protein